MARLRRERHRQHDVVRPAQQLVQGFRTDHLLGAGDGPAGAPPQHAHVQSQRRGLAGERDTDRSGAEDREVGAGDFPNAAVAQRLDPVPAALLLESEGGGQIAREREQQRQHVLRNADLVESGRVREDHVALDQRREEIGLDSRRRRVDPAQPLRLREERLRKGEADEGGGVADLGGERFQSVDRYQLHASGSAS